MVNVTHSRSLGRQTYGLFNSAVATKHSQSSLTSYGCPSKGLAFLNLSLMKSHRPSSLHRQQSTQSNGLNRNTQRRRSSSGFRATTAREPSRSVSTDVAAKPQMHRCFVAFGSNVGDRLSTIEQACMKLDAKDGVKLRRTSGIWQTKAMYVEDQNDFLNGVLEIDTTLDPLELLDTLQGIENSMGRKRTIDKGPRTLDLDILLHGNAIVQNDRLEIPHRLMLERPFVLQPLCELIPNQEPPSSPGTPYQSYLNQLAQNGMPMSTLVQLSQHSQPLTPLISSRQTRLMSILNVTPDSFSDGGLHSPSDLSALRDTIESHMSTGATIIDVGGESTRPHAAPVTPSEEKSRVLPAIKLINSLKSSKNDLYNHVAISIDTYHACVARAAIEAGADIVNDVSGGTLDPEMLQTVAKLGCTVILMHMRGDPSTMTSKKHTTYPDGLVEMVGAELLNRVRAAEEAGIRRWRIVLDPGIGFAKTGKQNLELLRRFEELKRYPGLEGMPWVVGASRKGFIGTITGVKDARERTWGTAAAVTASVQGGADVVRVHDVDEMRKVVSMADAIWRVNGDF